MYFMVLLLPKFAQLNSRTLGYATMENLDRFKSNFKPNYILLIL